MLQENDERNYTIICRFSPHVEIINLFISFIVTFFCVCVSLSPLLFIYLGGKGIWPIFASCFVSTSLYPPPPAPFKKKKRRRRKQISKYGALPSQKPHQKAYY